MEKRSKVSAARAAQGLATLALLKVNFDQGHDHIEMFMPFVWDSVASLPENTFGIEDIRARVRERHELNLPESVLATLLGRATRRGEIRRELGRYVRFPGRSVADSTITEERSRVEREHANVATALREFAAGRDVTLGSNEDALALLLRFFEQFHIALLIDDSPSPLFRMNEVVSRREVAVVARFLEETFAREPTRTEYVQRMLAGFVLQNALLLKDLGLATRRFQRLFVYLDTGFILRVLGLAGDAHATSTRETLDLLKATGAEFGVFEKTIEEIERILRLYERKLRTHEGILSLRAYDVTRHLVANHYSPSDVAAAIGTLRENLAQLGIKIRALPKREAFSTSNESALTGRLRRPDESELEPRVTHDVDCVAAILTIRRGENHSSLDTAPAVFATTSSSVVRTVREWYRESSQGGVPPVIHAWALSNAAWLKKPTAATSKKLHELVALCSAALQPTPKAWKAFLKELKRLESEGKITSSEQIALVARELVACRLAEVEGDGEVDAKTISEVVERAMEESLERTRVAVGEVKSEAEAKLAAAGAALATAQAAQQAEAEKNRQRDLHIRGRVLTLARWASGILFAASSLTVAAGVALGLPDVFPHTPGLASVSAWIAVILVAVLGTMNLVEGTTVRDLRLRLQALIEGSLLRWLVARDETRP